MCTKKLGFINLLRLEKFRNVFLAHRNLWTIGQNFTPLKLCSQNWKTWLITGCAFGDYKISTNRWFYKNPPRPKRRKTLLSWTLFANFKTNLLITNIAFGDYKISTNRWFYKTLLALKGGKLYYLEPYSQISKLICS